MNEKLQALGAELHVQDNAATADPIFMVQQKKRVYGLQDDYGTDTVWLEKGGEGAELTSDEAQVVDDEGGETEEVGVLDLWENVQPFFTQKGAEEYLRINGHNLREPRIYVESAFRNAEWQQLRAHLMTQGWISVKDALPPLDGGDMGMSANVLVTDGAAIYSAYLHGFEEVEPRRWSLCGGSAFDLPGITHWQPYPGLPRK
jgi:hypothetical protein